MARSASRTGASSKTTSTASRSCASTSRRRSPTSGSSPTGSMCRRAASASRGCRPSHLRCATRSSRRPASASGGCRSAISWPPDRRTGANSISLSAGGGEGRGEVGIPERLPSPTSPSRAARGPLPLPLKGEEGLSPGNPALAGREWERRRQRLTLYYCCAILSNMESVFLIMIGRSASGSRWSLLVSLLPPSAPPIGSLLGGLRFGANYLICRALRLVFAVKSSFLPALREASLAGGARRCVLEGASDRIEGGVGFEIGVERQRARGGLVGPPFRLVGLMPDDPAVPVRQAPGHDHLDRGLVECGIEEPAVGVGDQAVSNRHVGGCILVGDVELGDLDRQAETRDVGEKPPQQRCRKGRSADRRQMGLDADGIERCPGSPHLFEKMEQCHAARLMLGGVELDIVFVDDQAGLGIGVPRGMIGEIEILGSERLEKHRGAQTVRSPVLGFDRLVDNVPAVDPSAIPAGQLLDVVENGPLLLGSVGQVEKPVWSPVVPQEIVAAQDEAVGRGEGGDGVGGTVFVIPRGASVHDLPLHLVLGDDETGFLTHEINERPIAGGLRRRNSRPIKKSPIGRQFAKRDGRGNAAAWREQRDHAAAKRREAGGKNATSAWSRI